MAIDPSDQLTERDSGATWVRKANKLLGQVGVDLGATEAARDAAGGHAAQADSAAASAAGSAAHAAQIRAGQRQGGPLIMPSLLLDWGNNPALDPRIRYSRAGDAWEDNPAGVLARHGANAWPWNGGRSVWPTLTNKLTCRKHNPTDTAGFNTQGAGIFSVVVDAAEVAAAGLSLLCTSGTVYKLDCSALPASEASHVFAQQTVGAALATHSVSAYVRGNGQFRLSLYGVGGDFSAIPAKYSRASRTVTPAGSINNIFSLAVMGGGVAYFIIPQSIEAPYAGPVTPGDTLAATTRSQDRPPMPLGDWYNPREGVWVIDYVQPADLRSTSVLTVHADAGNRIDLRRTAGTGNMVLASFRDGFIGADLNVNNLLAPAGQRNRVGIRYDYSTGVIAFCANGGPVRQSAPVALAPSTPYTTQSLGMSAAGTEQSGIRFTSETYYPLALGDAEFMMVTTQ